MDGRSQLLDGEAASQAGRQAGPRLGIVDYECTLLAGSAGPISFCGIRGPAQSSQQQPRAVPPGQPFRNASRLCCGAVGGTLPLPTP